MIGRATSVRRWPLPEEQPRAEGHDDDLHSCRERSPGRHPPVDRVVPEDEVAGEENACEQGQTDMAARHRDMAVADAAPRPSRRNQNGNPYRQRKTRGRLGRGVGQVQDARKRDRNGAKKRGQPRASGHRRDEGTHGARLSPMEPRCRAAASSGSMNSKSRLLFLGLTLALAACSVAASGAPSPAAPPPRSARNSRSATPVPGTPAPGPSTDPEGHPL